MVGGVRLLTLAILALALLPPGAAANTRIIVKRDSGLTASQRADIRADADVRYVESLQLPRTEVVAAPRGDVREALRELKADPDVVYAEPDRIRTAQATAPDPDPDMSKLWALDNADDFDINAVAAWAFATGDGQRIAVVDTGVKQDHPDLTDPEFGSQVTSGYSFVAPRGPDYSDLDEQSHGTHITATIAARRENGVGIAGVAPDARIMALRALARVGSGPTSSVSGLDSDIAEAFRHAGAAGVRVVNASLAAPGASQTLRDAFAAYPNTLFVVAAGNGGHDNDANPIYPCNTPEPNVLCVGASTHLDGIAAFSNFGVRSVDVFAPGQGIYSTMRDGGHAYKQGTSMATAHVSATAALVLQANPSLTTKQLKEVLLASAEEKPAFAASVSGARLDAEAAVNMALAGAPTEPDADGDRWVDAADACWEDEPVAFPGDGCVSDHDWDGIDDTTDNCDLDPDPDQTDLDGDGRGAPCDSTPYGHNNDGDHLWEIYDACPNTYGTLANGCPASPPPSPPPNRDGDDRVDSIDYCPTEYAISNDGCPLPQVASLSGKARKRGKRRSVTVKVTTTRLANVRVTIERKRGKRWVRVKRRRAATVANRVRVAVKRVRPGRYRVRVSISNGAGRGTPVRKRFRVR